MPAMTIPVHEEVGEIALTIPCDTCKAGLGDPCTDSLGRTIPKTDGNERMHVARVTPILIAYRAGRRQGRREMKKEMQSAVES